MSLASLAPLESPAPLVYITGASSGIGQALALRYYQAGWRLALVARRAAEMQQWAQAEGLSADRWAVYGADVSEIDSITAAGRQCMAAQGLPDVVIANAGISIGIDTAIFSDLAVMQRLYATNNIGMAATFHPFLAAMNQRGRGCLVGVASVAGIRGLPGHAAYCSSKAAVISYCESLRGECRPHGVHVLTLVPGYIDTPLTQKNRYGMPFLMSPERFADKAFEAIAQRARFQVIPWQMGWVARLLRLLPDALFDRLLAGRPRKHRQDE
ncbi:SDR family oxidoreductase [Roseateles koreensis]|uniref:SDR family oxidoreductase n=1 Tax=Roseateles koreensis TaxID=2987526 RepID=A0ABT5KV00_9BURK|nr:SDR family oxidoreductase [Roseateles koreensis]MDC8785617.1 SDR family oxidoreductase [Roseateles koreensis]